MIIEYPVPHTMLCYRWVSSCCLVRRTLRGSMVFGVRQWIRGADVSESRGASWSTQVWLTHYIPPSDKWAPHIYNVQKQLIWWFLYNFSFRFRILLLMKLIGDASDHPSWFLSITRVNLSIVRIITNAIPYGATYLSHPFHQTSHLVSRVYIALVFQSLLQLSVPILNGDCQLGMLGPANITLRCGWNYPIIFDSEIRLFPHGWQRSSKQVSNCRTTARLYK